MATRRPGHDGEDHRPHRTGCQRVHCRACGNTGHEYGQSEQKHARHKPSITNVKDEKERLGRGGVAAPARQSPRVECCGHIRISPTVVEVGVSVQSAIPA